MQGPQDGLTGSTWLHEITDPAESSRFMAHNVHFPHVPYLLVPAAFRPVLACHHRHRHPDAPYMDRGLWLTGQSSRSFLAINVAPTVSREIAEHGQGP